MEMKLLEWVSNQKEVTRRDSLGNPIRDFVVCGEQAFLKHVQCNLWGRGLFSGDLQ